MPPKNGNSAASKKSNAGTTKKRKSSSSKSVATAKRSKHSADAPRMRTIQWVGFTDNKYHLFPEAQSFLESVDGPVAVMAVVGAYRSGKSYLLNRLCSEFGVAADFEVSPTIHSCTKGLWLLDPAITMADGTRLIIMDTEGLGSLEASENHDLRTFSLALLLSSIFLFNCVGPINEAALANLSLVSSIAQHVRGKSSSRENSFPYFFWVARDFSLQLVDDQNAAIDATTYLNNALAPNPKAPDAKNRIREAITELFGRERRECVTLVRPTTDETKLQHLSSLPAEELREEFRAGITLLSERIASRALPFSYDDMSLTGPLLSKLAQVYVDAVNEDAVPVVEDSWTLLSQNECRRVAEACRRRFQTGAAALAQDDVGSIRDFRSSLGTLLQTTLDQFARDAMGPAQREIATSLEAELRQTCKSYEDQGLSLLRTRVTEQLDGLRRRSVQEAPDVATAIRMFAEVCRKHEDSETRGLWCEAALAPLTTALETLTYRSDKQRLELQTRVDTADVELARVRMEAEAKAREIRQDLEAARELCSRLEDEVAAARTKTQAAERVAQGLREELRHKESLWEREKGALEEERAALQRAELPPAPEEDSSFVHGLEAQVHDLTEALRQQASDTESQVAKAQAEREEALRSVQSLEERLESVLHLETDLRTTQASLDESERARLELESALKTMEAEHEESAASVQREAMETVRAIREVLKRERERAKKQSAQHEATLAKTQSHLQSQLQNEKQRAEQAESLASQRQAALEEVRARNRAEVRRMQDELERSSDLLATQRQSHDTARQELFAQLQDLQKSAASRESSLLQDQQRLQRESATVRRKLETENATLQVRLDAATKRTATAEDKCARLQSEATTHMSSSVELARLRNELAHAERGLEGALEKQRALEIENKDLQQSSKDLQRRVNAEKTKLMMSYERKISILESRLIE